MIKGSDSKKKLQKIITKVYSFPATSNSMINVSQTDEDGDKPETYYVTITFLHHI